MSFCPANDRVGVLTDQDADQVFLLDDLLLEGRNFSGGRENQLFGLAHIEHRCGAPIGKHVCEPQRFLT